MMRTVGRLAACISSREIRALALASSLECSASTSCTHNVMHGYYAGGGGQIASSGQCIMEAKASRQVQ